MFTSGRWRRSSHGFLTKERVLLDLDAEDMEGACRQLVTHLVGLECVPEDKADDLLGEIMRRERISSTALGLGAAVPHAYVEFVETPVVLLARLQRPLDLGAPDGVPTDLVFLLVGHDGDESTHLETLMEVSRLMLVGSFRDAVHSAGDPAQVLEAVEVAQEHLHGVEKPEPTLARAGIEERSGSFAGGLIADVRRRLPHFVDDFKQGLSARSLAATVFLFFACFTGALTFGGIMAEATGGTIGVSQMVVATAIGGVIYAFFAGQPLIVLGGVGPVLIFTGILYTQSVSLDLPFLPVYAWVGLWSALFTMVLAVTDASVLMRYLTRFTDEIFVILVAAIFVVEAVKKLVHAFDIKDYATALSTVILAVGTFVIAVALKSFRSRSYLRAWARNFLADFGTVIAILAMVILAGFMANETSLDHVKVSAEGAFALHLVDLGQLPLTWILLCAIPASFLTILLFLCQQITGRVCNAPDLSLEKGPGYHLDLFVVGVLTAFCSLFGLPWLVAATVRSLNHVQALSSSHVEDSPGGGSIQIDRVVENRLSGVAIHVLIACALFLAPFLERIPMACLYGIFLYMGFVSFGGNQFFQRLILWVQDPKLYPATHYVRRVPIRAVHLFTAVQLVCFVILWAVQASNLALFFPLFLALLVPLRALLTKVFRAVDLAVLDSEETWQEDLSREAE
jgi:mannitol/fructose-specific phosphotransferase system IIA component (Ntr-type)